MSHSGPSPFARKNSVFQKMLSESSGRFARIGLNVSKLKGMDGMKKVKFWLGVAVLSGGTASAQMVVSNQYCEVSALTNQTVEIYGRSELHFTGSDAPLSECSINLRSIDAWVFLHEVKPSSAVTLLGQFKVDGAAAVLDENVRVVQHGQGAVIIPYPADFQPLTIYNGENFSGTSMALSPYTKYGTSALDSMAGRMSSFILKRGYTATFAQNPDGSGRSRNYVAADGDLEIGAVPDWMDDKVYFIRVFPWRWVGKKGSCDIAPDKLDADWHYNWSISKTSTLDWEYVGIRQTRYWPSLSQDWEYRGINQLSGYNEPANSSEDAYASLNSGSVSAAVAGWSDLLATGLRVGAPAVTDGGRSWLYSFMESADSAGKRVDYVPIHFYWSFYNNDWPAGAADQLYTFLKAVHDEVQRPIWVTEFNNGANWTDDTYDPSTSQNKNVIEAMIKMMDETPWIERYAVYSSVEWFRQTHYDDGSLTPMGSMYKNHVAPIGYVQELKKNRSRVASYYFDGDCADASGCGNAGVPVAVPEFVEGKHGQAIELDGTNSYVQLPGDIAKSSAFTFAAWIYWNGGANNQRIFDFGNYDRSQYMVLSPSQSGVLGFALKNGGSTSWVSTSSALPAGEWKHVAVTVSSSTVKIYLDGLQQSTSGSISGVSALSETFYNYLGKSQWSTDPLFSGKLDDVHIANYAMSAEEIASMVGNSMLMQVPQNVTATEAAAQGAFCSGSVAGAAVDPDADSISYYKVYGPDWLTLNADGTYSGTPGFNEEGPQLFTVRAIDNEGERRYFTLTVELPYLFGDGVWTADQDGVWSDTANWLDGFPANGAGETADFSTMNITEDRTVTLGESHYVGALKFGDLAGGQSWTLASDEGGAITLDTDSADQPTVEVVNSKAVIEASLGGTNGLMKSGAGTLVLAGASSLSGTVNADTASSSENDGVLCIAHPSALVEVDTLQVRNTGNGSSALLLDGSRNGDLVLPLTIEWSGRDGSVSALQNGAGTNELLGGITLNDGGAYYGIESKSGVLTLGGIITSAASGTRGLSFKGNGDACVSGIIQDGSADSLKVTKTGSGCLTLAGNNQYSGVTTLSAGELKVEGTTGTGATTISFGTILSGGGTVLNNLTAYGGSIVRVGGEGFELGVDSSFVLIDDFEGYTTGDIGAKPNTTGDLWTGVFDGTANADIVAASENQALGVVGIPSQSGSPWRGAITDLKNGRAADFSLPDGETGTYFFRIQRTISSAMDAVFGFTDQAASSSSAPGNDIASPYNEYAVMLQMSGSGNSGSLNARNGTSGLLTVASGISNEWVNVWVVVNQSNHTFRVASSEGEEDGVDSGQTFAFGYRTAETVGTNSLICFGVHESKGDEIRMDDFYYSPGSNLKNPLNVGALVPQGATLHVARHLTLKTGATLEFNVSSSNLYDRLVVGGALDASGILKVSLDPDQPAPWEGDSFDLFDANGGTVAFAAYDLPALAEGLSWDTSAIASGELRVIGAPSGYAHFMQHHGMSAARFDGDANSNGIPNGMEYYLGWDPADPSSPSRVLQWSNNYSSVYFPYNASAVGVTGAVEWTTDLRTGPWSSSNISYLTNSSAEEIEATLGAPVTNGLFLRLRVNQ